MLPFLHSGGGILGGGKGARGLGGIKQGCHCYHSCIVVEDYSEVVKAPEGWAESSKAANATIHAWWLKIARKGEGAPEGWAESSKADTATIHA